MIAITKHMMLNQPITTLIYVGTFHLPLLITCFSPPVSSFIDRSWTPYINRTFAGKSLLKRGPQNGILHPLLYKVIPAQDRLDIWSRWHLRHRISMPKDAGEGTGLFDLRGYLQQGHLGPSSVLWNIYKHGKEKPSLCRTLQISQYPLINFRLNKAKMVDTEVWSRWKVLARTILTIPKFKSVWTKTKDIHSSEFRDFIDSLWWTRTGDVIVR